MHSCIATLLSVLATLSSAWGFLSANKLPEYTIQSSQAPVGTCLTPYTSYFESAYFTVFLRHPNEPYFDLAVLTGYTQFYPDTLVAWLVERGFDVFYISEPTDDDLCGWLEYDSVDVGGRRHGQIGWKRTRLYLNADASQTGNSTSVRTVPELYVPHDAPIKPSHNIVEVVKTILLTNTPHADIYSSRCFMLKFGLAMLGVFLAEYILIVHREQIGFFFAYYILVSLGIHRLEASKDSDDIELNQIKVQDPSGSAMQRMDTDDCDAPKFNIEITNPNATRSSPSSMGSGIATPPPMYALNGAGRSVASVHDMV
ncbi:hypothetical protein E8E11_001976 [Didymella keratinophila]|nr:hypothetical protein E8E11_001976 [Didymella keratinophila]